MADERRGWVRNSGAVDEWFPQVAHLAEAGTFDAPDTAASAASTGPVAAAQASEVPVREDGSDDAELQPDRPRRKLRRHHEAAPAGDAAGIGATVRASGDEEKSDAVYFGCDIGVDLDDQGRVRCDATWS